MTITRRKVLKGSSAVLLSSLAAPHILKAQATEYVFGASLPMTGPYATAGQLVAPVFKMFEVLTNQSGGIKGTPIRTFVEDSGYVPQNALANYQRAKAKEKNMVHYFGDSTGFMKLVAPELKGENAILMGSTSFSSDLANPSNNPYQYLAGPTYQDQFDIILQAIKAEGGKKVAFIYANNEFGRDPLEHGRKKAKELGIEVVLEESTKAQGADIPTHVTKLAQSNAEYCILQGYVTGVWPQLIGGARKFGLPTKFMGTFWGMEKLVADKVTAQAGPFLDGYSGVMHYKYFYDRDQNSRYETYAAFAKKAFAGTPLENYLPTWALAGLCSLEMAKLAIEKTIEGGKDLSPDNLSASLGNIKNWDSGGFFGSNVDVVDNKIGVGRIYTYSAETKLFTPSSEWLAV
tara:strand:+ start:419 stop:1627 length:1209 start_codon:yes stop_codon:yes gene_type:complete